MVTLVGGRICWAFAHSKNVQSCRFRSVVNETRHLQAAGLHSLYCCARKFSSSVALPVQLPLSLLLQSSFGHMYNSGCRPYDNLLSTTMSCSSGKTRNHYLPPKHKKIMYCTCQYYHHSSRDLLIHKTLPAVRDYSKDSSTDNVDTDGREKRSSLMNIEELVEYLREENALDICVISVPPSLDYVDYFVVCSGYGTRHLRKMADGLVTELKSVRIGRNNRRIRVEGQDCDDWMAVEMGTIVVHFMTEEARLKYELEKLWTLGPRYDDQYRNMKVMLESNP